MTSNPVPADPVGLAAWVKTQARSLGFDDVGIAHAAPAQHAAHFRAAVQEGRLALLPYLEERVEERCDPRVLLPGARSVVMVLMGYREERPPAPLEPHAKVARYAARRDYHNPMIKKLRSLRSRIQQVFPDSGNYVASDTGAVLERSWAQQAGLGWIGKSAMLLSREWGTYTLLGSLITSLELAPDQPQTDQCGTCTACLDACPTGAIVAPGKVDASRCITTWTVENPGEDIPAQAPPLHGWAFGCDECQEACPYQARGVLNPALPGRPELAFLPLEMAHSGAFPPLDGTPVSRAKVKGLIRNLRGHQAS